MLRTNNVVSDNCEGPGWIVPTHAAGERFGPCEYSLANWVSGQSRLGNGKRAGHQIRLDVGGQRSVVTLDLPPEPTSATVARRVTRKHLAVACPSEAVEVAALLVTELVSNAVLHARTAIVVAVDCTPGRVSIRVADQSAALPRRRTYGSNASTGRGIALVDELATAWGVERSLHGKEVWCEIEFPVTEAGRHAQQVTPWRETALP
jgi:anti-sigma regulatory factor (Ser/Thr protein kinase)